jgi:alkylated DNA repair dioxygenase AlkB
MHSSKQQPKQPAEESAGVPGLQYLPDYLPADEQAAVLAFVDAAPWSGALSRRTQHYGWRYDYQARRVDESLYLGPLPDWAQTLADQFVTDGFVLSPPDQMIVGEYLPGQGIAPHVDCRPCFGPVIFSLSLGSACIMQFESEDTGEKQELRLEPGSLLVLSGEARERWRHSIPARKSDPLPDGTRSPRERRVSLTFRTVVREYAAQ